MITAAPVGDPSAAVKTQIRSWEEALLPRNHKPALWPSPRSSDRGHGRYWNPQTKVPPDRDIGLKLVSQSAQKAKGT